MAMFWRGDRILSSGNRRTVVKPTSLSSKSHDPLSRRHIYDGEPAFSLGENLMIRQIVGRAAQTIDDEDIRTEASRAKILSQNRPSTARFGETQSIADIAVAIKNKINHDGITASARRYMTGNGGFTTPRTGMTRGKPVINILPQNRTSAPNPANQIVRRSRKRSKGQHRVTDELANENHTVCITCRGSLTDHEKLLGVVKKTLPNLSTNLTSITFEPLSVKAGDPYSENRWLLTFDEPQACYELEETGLVIGEKLHEVKSYSKVMADEQEVDVIKKILM